MVDIILHEDTEAQRTLGRAVAHAVGLFLAGGVKQIERACNERRTRVLEWLGTLDGDRNLPEWGLANITVVTSIEEATPQFNLDEPPQNLRIDLLRTSRQENPDVSMAYRTDGVILVYQPPISPDWVRSQTLLTKLNLITWHEMLHACGDVQYDGIVRHNKIGLDAVMQVLSGSCPSVQARPVL